MQGINLRKYGVAATIPFELYEVDGVDFRVDAIHAGGDSTRVKDGGAEQNTTNGFADEGKGYSITLTAGEMQAAEIVVYIVDQTATKVWLDKAITIETYGHASAQHAFDLDDAVHTKVTTLLTGTPTTKYMGPRGPGVYVDSGAANTNTVTGTDGTISNPVSTFAAARTIADAIGVTRYYLEGNSDITLAATHVDWEFIGVGSVADNIVNLGSQDVSRSLFVDLTIEGTQGGSGRIEAIECALQDPGAGATTLHIFALRCGLVDDIEVDTSNNNVFDACFSLVAGATTPKIIATGASGTIEIRHYSGGIELSTLSASHNVSIEGMGQVIFTADCNVNANVSIRGLFTITDNTAGMASLTQDAVVNMPKINAEADTALSDYAPNIVVPDAAGVAPTATEIVDEWETQSQANPTGFHINLMEWRSTAVVTGAIPAFAADTAGGLPVSDAGGLDLDTQLANTNEVTAARMGALTDWINGGRLDLILDIIAVDTTTDIPALIAGLNNISAADVNTQVVDVLRTDIVAELSAVPAASPNLHAMVQWVYMEARNKRTSTATQSTINNDAGAAIGTSTDSDDSTTFTRGEYA